MSEILTEKPADTAEPVDITVESTTESLSEEMKKAVKQSAFTFIRSSQLSLPCSLFFFWVSLSKKVEFYFADANLPYDKCTNFWVLSFLSMLNERFRYRFMWTLYMKDPEHWIPIQTVASFKRMRQFGSHGLEWVTNALRLSDVLQVDETGTKVRRTTEPQPPKNQFERSVYAVRVGVIFTY